MKHVVSSIVHSYDVFLLTSTTFANMNISFIGVTEFCGLERVSISYRMSVVNRSFQITDLFMAYFGLRLSHLMAD